MAELYGVNEELPAELADVIVDEDKPVGPAGDPETATADDDQDGDK